VNKNLEKESFSNPRNDDDDDDDANMELADRDITSVEKKFDFTIYMNVFD
jgi:hypothetical protein